MKNRQRNGRPPVERTQVVETLRRQIVSGRIPPGERFSSRRTLAAQLDVAPVTVDQAFHQLIRDGFVVSRGTAGRFVASRPPHLHQFALILPVDPRHGLSRSRFYDALVAETERITRSAEDNDFGLYTGISGHVDSEDYQKLVRDVESERLAGLVFAFPGFTPYGGRVVDAGGLPQVLIATNTNGEIPAVYPDMSAWFRLAVDRAKSRGKRRIATLQLPQMSGFQDWYTTLTMLCEDYGLETSPWLTQYAAWSPGVEPRNVAHTVQLMMRLPDMDRPDTLLVTDDHLVEGVEQGLEAAGVTPGVDLELIAHCNWPTAPAVDMQVTWLGFDSKRIIRVCLEKLDAQREGKDAEQMTWIPPEFEN